MNSEVLRLFIPLLLVVGGLFLRQTKNESDQAYKKYWKVLVIIGIVGFILKLIAYLM
jgi:4-hydroxybenzoate polyprenyltransferase